MTENSSTEKSVTTATTSAKARYGAITFDCADPAEQARFYSSVLDLPVSYSSDDFVALGHVGQPGIAFVRIEGYQRPTWPQPAVPKQAHFDLGVDDLDTAQAELIALGATAPPTQPQPDRWRVLLDPAGHPFCVSTAF
jgi:catechol 2,3-dioxygenase-like lactoylglutathione lyase family enzyme